MSRPAIPQQVRKGQNEMDTTGAKTKLRWRIQDREFEDGSQLKQWRRIENTTWIPQPYGYELTFSIYEHAGGFWKLYRARLRTHEGSYANSYGAVTPTDITPDE